MITKRDKVRDLRKVLARLYTLRLVAVQERCFQLVSEVDVAVLGHKLDLYKVEFGEKLPY